MIFAKKFPGSAHVLKFKDTWGEKFIFQNKCRRREIPDCGIVGR